jgi:hypothetical protein
MSACTLKVPGVSLALYQAADTWEDFGTIEALAPVADYSAEICYGGSYTDANFTEPIDAAGVYYAALANSAGCDSIVRLNLTLSPHGVTGSLSWSICDNTLTITGTGAMPDYSSYGAEAPWISHRNTITGVTVGNGVTTIGEQAFYGFTALTEVIIPNSVQSIGDAAFTSCTGLVSLTLGNGVASIGANAFENCPGITSLTFPESVTHIGGWAFYDCSELTSITSHAVTPPSMGEYAFGYDYMPADVPVYVPCLAVNEYENANGWDYFTNYIASGAVTEDTTYYSVEICSGGAYTDANFTEPIDAAGVYYAVLANSAGYDSIVELTLTVHPVHTTPLAASICEGESYVFFGETLTAAGVYQETLPTANGCDSIVELSLTVHPVHTTPLAASICEGESYDFFGETLTAAGVYQETLPTANGCDSIVELSLTVHPVHTTPLAASICEGESYVFFGETLTAAGVYRDTLPTVNGCDSIIELTLTVHPLPETPEEISGETFVVVGSEYQYSIAPTAYADSYRLTISNLAWQLDDNNTQATLNITNTILGILSVAAVNSCGVSDTSNVTITSTVGVVEIENTLSLRIYPNPTTGLLTIENGKLTIGNIRIYDMYGRMVETGHALPSQDVRTTIDISHLPSGSYLLKIETEQGTATTKVIKN